MPCYSPLEAFRGAKTKTGKPSIVFNKSQAILGQPIKLPCGQCIGCRLERSRQWAMRCVHEAQLHEENSFITLTYSNEHLPRNNSLIKSHFQRFMKRLRKHYQGKKIRFYHCGEYGEKFARPHYHACLFGLDFQDKELWKTTNGIPLFTSETLSNLWPYGFTTVGEVTFDSAAYVARYVLKKQTGENANTHYSVIDSETGEITDTRQPEYTTMSRGRKPDGGIGALWYDKYKTDVFPSDFLIVNGQKVKPPKYYDSLYEIENPDQYKKIKKERLKKAKTHKEDQTPERLKVRETCKIKQTSNLKRTYENDV